MGHKAEGCSYIVQRPEKVHVDAGMENQTSQNKTTEQVGPDESHCEPWVLVSRNRKYGKRGTKDAEMLAKNSKSNQSPIKPICSSSPVVESFFSGLDKNKKS